MEPAMDLESPVGKWHIDEEETELELKEAHRNIIMNESRLGLMRNLLEHGLCTRDIYSFICSQADLCVTNSDPDRVTMKNAMKKKIQDLVQTIKNDHRKRRHCEKQLLRLVNGRSWVLRKKIRSIKNSVSAEQEKILNKHKKKNRTL